MPRKKTEKVAEAEPNLDVVSVAGRDPVKRMRAARKQAETFAAADVPDEKKQAAMSLLAGETIKVAQSWFGKKIYDDNPDDLVRNKGINLRVYKQMLADPYIKAAITQVKAAIVAPGAVLETIREHEVNHFVLGQAVRR